MFRSRQGHQLLRPLSNNTKASSQCVNCLIFIHTVTTALSDCLLNIFTWQLYSHKSYSVISYYSSIQQGVDTHPCLVTIYRLFTDTGQEVSAPNVSKHNRHQLSHQLSVVIASTHPSPGHTQTLFKVISIIFLNTIYLCYYFNKCMTVTTILVIFISNNISEQVPGYKMLIQTMQMHSYNTIQYNTTSFISNIEQNNITTTIYSQHWDGWKGGGQKNNLTVVHLQH